MVLAMAFQHAGGLACLQQRGMAIPRRLSPPDSSVIRPAASQSRRLLHQSTRTSESNKETRTLHVVRSGASSPSESNTNDSGSAEGKEQAPFGYSRKDVLLIGLGVTALGIGLKYGLEFAGVDSLQAGNAVQLIIVLGMTVGWISTYIFRVANKDMTYAKQLRDYEKQVMQKRLDSLSEAELQALLQQVEEEKARMSNGTDNAYRQQ